ncbi:hypothetical protein AAG906_003135 [Vitis piasezkii]
MSTLNGTMLNVFLVFLGFLVMVLLHLIDWRFRTLADSVFQAFPRITKVIFAVLLAFGCTSFPDALPSLGRSCQRVGQRIIGKLHSLFARIQQFDLRRDPPVLPITNMDTGNPAPS